MTSENGSATVYAILSIAALSLLVAAASGPEIQAGVRLRAEEASSARDALLVDAVSGILEALADDPTPLADSMNDPVWDSVKALRTDGITISLQDISSGFNLNAINPKWLEEPSFALYLNGTASASNICKQRIIAFFSNQEDVKDYIAEDTLGSIFSLYGYVNPNTTDPETIAKYIEDRIEDTESAVMIASDLSTAALSEILYGKDVDRILGPFKEKINPVVAPVPMINVNMAERKLLEIVLSLPYDNKGLKKSSEILDGLMADKLAGEVLPSDILSRIETENTEDGGKLVLSFLGTTTWFWKITAVDQEGTSLTFIAARIPDFSEEDTMKFQVINKIWENRI